MRPHRTILGASVAIAAVALTNLAPAQAATNVDFTNGLVDRVYGSGSDTLYPILTDLATAYMETDGCLLQSISASNFPPAPGAPAQMSCQSGAGAAIAGDNIYENYDHDLVVNYFPQGSNAGRGQLCSQKTSADGSGGDRASQIPFIDFARSSSAPGTGFQCTTAAGGELNTVLRFVAFARDAVSYTHWNTGTGGGAAVNNLTQAQLNDIFVDCTITDWGQVGGSAGDPIVVYTSIAGSGTRSFWDGFVGGNSQNCIPAQFRDGSYANGERVIREHQMLPVEAGLNDPGAADEGNSIYYMSTGLYNVSPQAGSSLLGSINGIAATQTTVQDGTFPAGRDLYVVYRNSGPNSPTASSAVRRFLGFPNPTATNGQAIGWICKAEANHSEPEGTTGPGIETDTAGQDWYEVKQEAYAQSGMYQLPADPTFGDTCNATNVTVTT